MDTEFLLKISEFYGVVLVETVVTVVVVGWTCVTVVTVGVLVLDELEYHQMPRTITIRTMTIHHTFAEFEFFIQFS